MQHLENLVYFYFFISQKFLAQLHYTLQTILIRRVGMIILIKELFMNITLHRRAEIAFRLLDTKEQKQLSKAFEKLITANEDFVKTKLRKLPTKSTISLYSYRGSNKLRLIVSMNDNTWVVEDIIDHDRLKQLPIMH